MKVKFANKIYEVLYTKEVAGKTMYAVEDEPNHIDWLVNVEVINEESEDERIRKELIKFLRNLFNNYSYFIKDPFYTECITWLEKQAEQNSNIVWHDITEEPEEQCEIFCEWKGSTNTIWHDVAFYHADTKTFWDGEHQIEDVIKWAYIDEMIKEQSQLYFASKSVSQALQKETVNIANEIRPKFKVGDWVVNNYCKGKIVELTNDAYLLDTGQGIPFSCEHNIHLWTIKDAKDGDVLVCESGWTCIFKTLVNEETFSSYCFMDSTEWFCETGSECHTLREEFVKAYNGKIQPATKEQRDLFFKKMQESGYEWNAEKKMLKNLKEESENYKQQLMSEITDLVKDYIQQKSAWTEEDEKKRTLLIKILEVNHPHGLFKVNSSETMRVEELISWLKSLNL